MEYATKKIPKSLFAKINRLKARLSLKKNRKVTEGEVIALALERLDEEGELEKRLSIMELSGIIPGGKKSSAREIDSIVYGV